MTEYKFKIKDLKERPTIFADLSGNLFIDIKGYFRTISGDSLFEATDPKDKKFHELTRNYYLNRDFIRVKLDDTGFQELEKFLIGLKKRDAVNVSVFKGSDDYFENFKVLED